MTAKEYVARSSKRSHNRKVVEPSAEDRALREGNEAILHAMVTRVEFLEKIASSPVHEGEVDSILTSIRQRMAEHKRTMGPAL